MSISKGVYIIGTGTNVGKTVVCAGFMYLLRSKGYNAGYFKPVSSGGIERDGRLISYDVSFVKTISRFEETDDKINPFRYKTPVSPHLASVIENLEVDKKLIFTNYKKLAENYEFIVIEGCGGLVVPLTREGYMRRH